MKTTTALAVAVASFVLTTAGSARGQSDHLKCYKVKDPQKFAGIVNLSSPQFGLESGCKIKINATELCAPATKTLHSSGGAPGAPIVGQTLTNAFVCYKIKCPAPFPPDVAVTDQFGPRTVSSLKPFKLCAPVGAAPADPTRADHLKCYKVKDPFKFKGVVDLATTFGLEQNCKVKLTARTFCVPAAKTVVQAGGAPALPIGGQALTNDQLCYKVQCPKPFPPSIAVADQFGSRTLSKLMPKTMCAPAIKTGGPGTTTTTTTTTTSTTTTSTTSTSTTSSTTTTMLHPPCQFAMAPACDGTCPPGSYCIFGAGICECVTETPGPNHMCGDFTLPPQYQQPNCWGDCPPNQVCVFSGGSCMCSF